MSHLPNHVILLADVETSRSKAVSIQSVIEVTSVEPSVAIQLLTNNGWNVNVRTKKEEAIAEYVNLRELRDRLSQAEGSDRRRLCILSVHLIRLTRLKHTGMHSVRLNLDGDIQQTGWISGDHSKFVGVSFEFRRFHPESRLRMEVWHKRTIRDNKMVGWCSWRISNLAEDPIMRFSDWITLNHKQTTGGSLQAEIWLRFFDLSLPLSMPSITSGRNTKSANDRRKGGSHTTSPTSSKQQIHNTSAKELTVQNENGESVNGKSKSIPLNNTVTSTSQRSIDLLDTFFGSSEVPSSSTSPSSATLDLGTLDPELFIQKLEKYQDPSASEQPYTLAGSDSISPNRYLLSGQPEMSGPLSREPESRTSNEERVSSTEQSSDNGFCTPQESEAGTEFGVSRKKISQQQQPPHLSDTNSNLVETPQTEEWHSRQKNIVSYVPILPFSGSSLKHSQGQLENQPNWDAWLSSWPEKFHQTETMPPDPWAEKDRQGDDSSYCQSNSFDGRVRSSGFVESALMKHHVEERELETFGQIYENKKLDSRNNKPPKFPSEDPLESNALDGQP